MTISERINLHRCGYTKDEINALAAAEKEELDTDMGNTVDDPAPAQPETEPAQPETAPASNNDVLLAIKELTKAIYAKNINTAPQPERQPDSINDLIKQI